MKTSLQLYQILFGFLLCVFVTLPETSSSQDITYEISDYHSYSVSCPGSNDGWITIVVVGGTPPYLYNWSNGSTSRNLTGLTAGPYQLTVTDAGLSTVNMDFELTEPLPMNTTLRAKEYEAGYNISEMGGSDGRIQSEISGGVLPYNYLWSNGSKEHELSGLQAGTYSLTTTSRNGCKDSASITLTEPSALQIVSITSPSQNGYNIRCFEKKDGTINLTVTGGAPPYEYKWIDGYSTEDRSELGQGTYIVVVTDFQQAKAIAQIVLTEPPVLEVQSTVYEYPNGRHVSCFGCSNGIITTTATGGVAPYTYLWQDGVTTANRSNVGVGGYSLVTTDGNGCAVETAVQLQGPEREDWTMSGNAGTNPPMQFFGTTDNKDVVFKTNNFERLKIKSTGEVEFKSSIKVDTSSTDSIRSVFVDHTGILRVSSQGASQQPCATPTNRWVTNYCNSSNDIYNLPITGNVGIGTSQIPSGYKLAVNGRIICEEVKVKLSSDWPDFVFEKNYLRMPLSELKKFISANHHLPGIPRASEVEMEGNNIGDMQAKLLEKIEELTLHLIDQDESLEKLQSENARLNKRLDQISRNFSK